VIGLWVIGLWVIGRLGFGVNGKDIILAVIREISAAGGTGYAIEFAGSAIEAMSMEGRMTVCNRAIEAGARSGINAPDDKAIACCTGRRFAPKGALWDETVAYWRTFRTDDDAVFDLEVTLDGGAIVVFDDLGSREMFAAALSCSLRYPCRVSTSALRTLTRQAALTQTSVGRTGPHGSRYRRTEDLEL
jgi:3-isopropylmalate/(R)-2-methylmalate dehydratase large subunit